ncbi:MAG: polysaccharide deacetylase family protein [Anaerolineae bacterium]
MRLGWMNAPRRAYMAVGAIVGGLMALGSLWLGPQPRSLGHASPPATIAAAPSSGVLRPAPLPLPTTTAQPDSSGERAGWPTAVPEVALALHLDGQARTARVPILMYHYVSDTPPGADIYRRDLTVSVAAFEAQLAYLRAEGYNSITLAELAQHLAEGRPLPEKPIVLTFDDGYEDAFLYAFPLLRQYGFRGTFFVITQYLDQGLPGYLSWEQAALMLANGMEIESHSVSHPDLRKLTQVELEQEIAGSRRSIEEHLNVPARFFCYPSGRYDKRVMAALRAAGYWGATTTAGGIVQTTGELFELKRVRVHGSGDVSHLHETLAYYGR